MSRSALYAHYASCVGPRLPADQRGPLPLGKREGAEEGASWDRDAGCLIGCQCHALKLLRLPSPLLSCFGLVVNVARVGLKIKKAHSLSLDKKTNRVYPSGCKKRKHQTELRQQQSGNKIIYNCNRQFTLQLQCGCCCYELPVSHAVVAACVCSRHAIGFVG